jgi:hypothetical protein
VTRVFSPRGPEDLELYRYVEVPSHNFKFKNINLEKGGGLIMIRETIKKSTLESHLFISVSAAVGCLLSLEIIVYTL